MIARGHIVIFAIKITTHKNFGGYSMLKPADLYRSVLKFHTGNILVQGSSKKTLHYWTRQRTSLQRMETLKTLHKACKN